MVQPKEGMIITEEGKAVEETTNMVQIPPLAYSLVVRKKVVEQDLPLTTS